MAVVVVASGKSTASFTLTTSPVATNTAVTITATYAATQKSATLTVESPALTGLSLNPNVVDPPDVSTSSGLVSLSGKAPSGGETVSLKSSSIKAQVPSSVTVAAGNSSATFTVNAMIVQATTYVTITATLNGVSASDQLQINKDITPACPYHLKSQRASPGTITALSGEYGLEFEATQSGTVTALRFHKAAGETGTHTGNLWSDTGELLAAVAFTHETSSGWQQAQLSSPVAILANTPYRVSVNVNTQGGEDRSASFASQVGMPLAARAGCHTAQQGSFPQTLDGNGYYADIVMEGSCHRANAPAQAPLGSQTGDLPESSPGVSPVPPRLAVESSRAFMPLKVLPVPIALNAEAFPGLPGDPRYVTCRDKANRLVSEYTASPSGLTRTRDYFYFGNLLVASEDGTGNFTFYVSDHLGTMRLETDAVGSVIHHDYLPYGEEMDSNATSTPIKFAGMERDASSGNDYDHARFSLTGMGRFLSVDPARGTVTNPLSWNRYSYVMDNPINKTDPTGLNPDQKPCPQGESSCGKSPRGDGTATQPAPTPVDNTQRIGNIVHNETGGLRPKTKTGSGSLQDLHNAKVAIAHVIHDRERARLIGGLASAKVGANERRSSQY